VPNHSMVKSIIYNRVIQKSNKFTITQITEDGDQDYQEFRTMVALVLPKIDPSSEEAFLDQLKKDPASTDWKKELIIELKTKAWVDFIDTCRLAFAIKVGCDRPKSKATPQQYDSTRMRALKLSAKVSLIDKTGHKYDRFEDLPSKLQDHFKSKYHFKPGAAPKRPQTHIVDPEENIQPPAKKQKVGENRREKKGASHVTMFNQNTLNVPGPSSMAISPGEDEDMPEDEHIVPGGDTIPVNLDWDMRDTGDWSNDLPPSISTTDNRSQEEKDLEDKICEIDDITRGAAEDLQSMLDEHTHDEIRRAGFVVKKSIFLNDKSKQLEELVKANAFKNKDAAMYNSTIYINPEMRKERESLEARREVLAAERIRREVWSETPLPRGADVGKAPVKGGSGPGDARGKT